MGLVQKYEEILSIRRRPSGTESADIADAMRSLSSRFPGALRELQSLSLATVEARLKDASEMLAGRVEHPWLRWMHEYHEQLRVALAIKAELGGRRLLTENEAETCAMKLSLQRGCECKAQWVHSIARPAGGRLSHWACARVEERLGLESGTLGRTLFPRDAP